MGRRATKHLNLPPGLRARLKPSGKVYYYLDTGGKPRREIPLGTDYVLAVKKWAALKHEDKSRAAIATFRYVAERYLLSQWFLRKAPRTQADNLKELAKLYAFFDAPPAVLERIDPVHVRQYLDWRTKEGRQSTARANRERALFSHIWNYALDRGYTAKANPCAGIKPFEERGRDVYVEAEVYAAVHEAACQPLRDAIELAYQTGQRPTDTRRMAETDLRGDVLELRQGKTGTRLRLRLKDDNGQPNQLGRLVERLVTAKAHHQVRSLALVCNEDGQSLSGPALNKRFAKARAKAARKLQAQAAEATSPLVAAGLRATAVAVLGFQFRDLRAKAGTDRAARDGAHKAQQQLGHASVTMTEHYLRNRRGDLVDPTG